MMSAEICHRFVAVVVVVVAVSCWRSVTYAQFTTFLSQFSLFSCSTRSSLTSWSRAGLSLCLFHTLFLVCLSQCLYVCLYLCLSFSVSVCLSVCLCTSSMFYDWSDLCSWKHWQSYYRVFVFIKRTNFCHQLQCLLCHFYISCIALVLHFCFILC